jgi:anti-sigma B factor antagonist
MQDPTQISSPLLAITTHIDGERVVVAVRGELDLATAPQLEGEVQALRSRGFASIVLDLRELTFMDSTGIRMLLMLDDAARTDGYAFAIVDCEGPVRRVLALTGVADRLAYAEL